MPDGAQAYPAYIRIEHRNRYVTDTCTPSREKRDAIFLWVLLGWLAFALLPSWSTDYGLLESTREEVLAAYSWSHFNISWLWYLLPSLLLVRPFQKPNASSAAATLSTRAGRYSVWPLLSPAPPLKDAA